MLVGLTSYKAVTVETDMNNLAPKFLHLEMSLQGRVKAVQQRRLYPNLLSKRQSHQANIAYISMCNLAPKSYSE